MNNARGKSEWEDTYGGGFGFGGGERLVQLPVDLLDPWTDKEGKTQPFHSYSSEELNDLADNIRKNGIIHPICARPRGARFEIIAGHNRCAAARLAGLRTVPVMVKDIDDDTAAILLVDSNLKQRETILPSEKAFAYKLKLDAMNRQGQRNDLTSRQFVGKLESVEDSDAATSRQFVGKLESMEDSGSATSRQFVGKLESVEGSGAATSRQFVGKLESAEVLGQQLGESGRNIQRYIRLTFLIPGLLELVDKGVLKLIAAVDISHLPQNIQEILLDLIVNENVKISTAKASELKKAMPQNELDVRAILEGKPKASTLKISLELDEMDIARLSGNRDFQKEAKKLLADLARHYLDADV